MDLPFLGLSNDKCLDYSSSPCTCNARAQLAQKQSQKCALSQSRRVSRQSVSLTQRGAYSQQYPHNPLLLPSIILFSCVNNYLSPTSTWFNSRGLSADMSSSSPHTPTTNFSTVLGSTIEAILHELLFSRSIYPPDSFVLHRHLGVRCHASRVPQVR